MFPHFSTIDGCVFTQVSLEGKLPTAGPSGKTAFITGASSGLGAEFARQLAARGYQLFLTARRADRLQQLGEEIQSRFAIDTHILPADLSKLPEIEALVSNINSLPYLDMLVNNAGFGTVGRFYRVDPGKELAMLNVHMVSTVMLTRAALPAMLSRNLGDIINVSSMAGLIPIRNVLYHSSKAFQISFSESLKMELSGTRLHVQALCPGFVLTEFHDTPEYASFSRQSVPRLLWMTPGQVVAESLNSLPRGNLICTPGGIYRFAAALARNSISAGFIKFFVGLTVNRRYKV
jgi:short-subunit dehydrogenase